MQIIVLYSFLGCLKNFMDIDGHLSDAAHDQCRGWGGWGIPESDSCIQGCPGHIYPLDIIYQCWGKQSEPSRYSWIIWQWRIDQWRSTHVAHPPWIYHRSRRPHIMQNSHTVFILWVLLDCRASVSGGMAGTDWVPFRNLPMSGTHGWKSPLLTGLYFHLYLNWETWFMMPDHPSIHIFS